MNKSIISAAVLSLLLVSNGCSKESSAKNGDKDETTTEVVAETTQEETAEAMDFEIRNADNQIVTIETDFGKMIIELYRDVAPAHADSFASLSTKGFYDGVIFHRIIKNFMIQGGDPTGTGTGDAGYYLNAEFSDLPHRDGTLSMARGPSPNSASCQFFVCLGENRSTSGLNGKYTVFGQVLKGIDVLHKIGDVKVQPNARGELSTPVETFYLRKAYLSDLDGNPLK